MDKFKVRTAGLEDWEDIQRLNRQIFEAELPFQPSSNLDYPDTPEAINYYQRAAIGIDEHVAFVATATENIVGYVIGKMISPAEVTHRVSIRLAQVHTLGVDEKFRGRGIGQMLLEHAEKWARTSGANKLKVVAFAGNKPARGLYVKYGFAEFEIVHEKDL